MKSKKGELETSSFIVFKEDITFTVPSILLHSELTLSHFSFDMGTETASKENRKIDIEC